MKIIQYADPYQFHPRLCDGIQEPVQTGIDGGKQKFPAPQRLPQPADPVMIKILMPPDDVLSFFSAAEEFSDFAQP